MIELTDEEITRMRNGIAANARTGHVDSVMYALDSILAEVRRLKRVINAYERDNCMNIQTIVDLRAKLGCAAGLLKTSAEIRLADVSAVLRDSRAPDGKWYVDAGTLVERLEAALKDAP